LVGDVNSLDVFIKFLTRTWVRHHNAPRTTKYVPQVSTNGPALEELSKERCTVMNFVDRKSRSEMDDWTGPKASQDMKKSWTGNTVFMKKEQPHWGIGPDGKIIPEVPDLSVDVTDLSLEATPQSVSTTEVAIPNEEEPLPEPKRPQVPLGPTVEAPERSQKWFLRWQHHLLSPQTPKHKHRFLRRQGQGLCRPSG
jgi:hypothetical protein